MEKLKKFSSPILRIGISIVFLWFGVNQIVEPNSYIGFLPDWLTGMSPVSPMTIVYLNGLFEIIFGTALLFGLYTRFVALLLFLHMADITFTVGFDAIGVRDFGITIASLVVWLNGYDFLTLDSYIKGTNSNTEVPPRQN